MEYLRQHTTSGTRIANLLIEHTSAVTSEIPRLTQLPVDSNCLWNYHISSLIARDTAALENSASACVVLWDQRSPTLKSAEFSQLVASIRRFFEFEARFGSMEVWRRRPEGTGPVASL